MALTGIQIYKLLPQTNCKECGFPTCLAFAMKLAAKQVELSECPYVSEEATEKLSEAAAPPVRPVSVSSNGNVVRAGNEVVLFRHEKTFYSRPGLFLRIRDREPAESARATRGSAMRTLSRPRTTWTHAPLLRRTAGTSVTARTEPRVLFVLPGAGSMIWRPPSASWSSAWAALATTALTRTGSQRSSTGRPRGFSEAESTMSGPVEGNDNGSGGRVTRC